MRYGLGIVTPPATEPVTLTEAKSHLRVDTSADDEDIVALVAVARALVENHTRRALITQTVELTLDGFGDPCRAIRLPLGRVQSITSVVYLDENGDEQTLDAANYRLDSTRVAARLMPVYGELWPSTYPEAGAVTITYVAGYGDDASDVPQPIRHAIKLFLGTYYDAVRATVTVGESPAKLPHAAEYLLGAYQVPLDLEGA